MRFFRNRLSVLCLVFLLASCQKSEQQPVSLASVVSALNEEFGEAGGDPFADIPREDIVESFDLADEKSPVRNFFAEQQIRELHWVTQAIQEAWRFSPELDTEELLGRYARTQQLWDAWLLRIRERRKELDAAGRVANGKTEALRSRESPLTDMDGKVRALHCSSVLKSLEVDQADFREAIESWVYRHTQATSSTSGEQIDVTTNVLIRGRSSRDESSVLRKSIVMKDVTVIEALNRLCEEYDFYFVHVEERVEIGRDVRYLPDDLYRTEVLSELLP